MSSSSAPLATPEGPGSVSDVPNLRPGFADTLTTGVRSLISPRPSPSCGLGILRRVNSSVPRRDPAGQPHA